MNYSVIERECLAIIFVVKKFQLYLYGKEFVLNTDHTYHIFNKRPKGLNGHLNIMFFVHVSAV